MPDGSHRARWDWTAAKIQAAGDLDLPPPPPPADLTPHGSTKSPPVAAMDLPLRDITGVPTAIVDFRDNSPDFAGGIRRELRADAAVKWSDLRPVTKVATPSDLALLAPKGTRGVDIGPEDADKNACIITLGGPVMSGPAAAKASRFAADVPLTPGSTDAGRSTDDGLDNFIGYHELRHCADPALFRDAGKVKGTLQAGHDTLLMEGTADSFATLMEARRTGSTATGELVADLRTVAAVKGGEDFSPQALSRTSGLAVSIRGLDHDTTPVIDATVARAKELGTEKLREMSPQELIEESARLSAANTLSPSAYLRMPRALSDTHIRDSHTEPGEGMPAADAKRTDEALVRMGYQPGSARTLYSGRASQSLDEAEKTAELELPAQIGPRIGRGLRTELEEGARPESVVATSRLISVGLRERQGECSSAFVAADGSVSRRDGSGAPANLSELRPASTGPDGRLNFITKDGAAAAGDDTLIAADEATRRRPTAKTPHQDVCPAPPIKLRPGPAGERPSLLMGQMDLGADPW